MNSPIPDWKRITKESYNTYAKEFATFTATYMGKMQQWTEQFAQFFPKGASILDIGCGAGRDAALFINKGLSITGIDFSEKLIALIKEKLPTGKFLLMDYEELSFPDNSFDGVWANASLYHMPKINFPPVLQKIHAILKKRGNIACHFSSW